jgi:hypothetical protein
MLLLTVVALSSSAYASDLANCDWPGVRVEEAKVYCEFRYLDKVPHNPELAAIAAWHKALVTDDFEAFSRIQNPTQYESNSPARLFPTLKEHVPERLIVGPRKPLRSGNAEYLIAGCRFVPEIGKEMRFIMDAIVVYTSDGLRVWGWAWSIPWTQMADKCPV